MAKLNNYKSELNELYSINKDDIKNKIKEFEKFFNKANDEMIFQELCFCILSSGVGPKIAQKSLEKIKNDLWDGNEELITFLLDGVHKYPEKASYIISTRNYFVKEIDFKIKSKIQSFK